MLEFLIGSDIIYGRIMNGSILFQIMIEIIIIISKILIGIKKENIKEFIHFSFLILN